MATPNTRCLPYIWPLKKKKKSSNATTVTIQFRDWKFGNDVAADDFAFKNASNATQVEVKDIKDKVGDLPQNFTLGAAK